MVDSNSELEQWKAENQTNLESLKGTFAFATAALKLITLANGAGAIALLAFLGHVVSSRASITEHVVSELSKPMMTFAFGTALGIVVTALAYLTQGFFTESKRPEKVGLRFQLP